MSRLVIAVCRRPDRAAEAARRVQAISATLLPSDIQPHAPFSACDAQVAVGIANPAPGIVTDGTNVLFGHAFGDTCDWQRPGGAVPDGNLAVFRSDSLHAEIATDTLATMPVWYVFDDDWLVASTSQRAIVQMLGSFEFNEVGVPWLLTNGVLGPGHSWDRRIRALPPASTLRLDRANWSMSVATDDIDFAPNALSDAENRRVFDRTVSDAVGAVALDYEQWRLSLSGGYDSRGLLYMLPRADRSGRQLSTITWGLRESLTDPKNDASIARRLADDAGVPHEYHATDGAQAPVDTVIDRFLRNGEGRIDHLGSYMDGFALWKELRERGVDGVIRGDEVFGSYDFLSDFHLRRFIGIATPQDYRNLSADPYLADISPQLPEFTRRRDDESFAQWRDRLYQACYVPMFLSALEDLKRPYVQQASPFLSRSIVMMVRQLPDHLRTEKRLFRELIDGRNSTIPFSKNMAIPSIGNLFARPDMKAVVAAELRRGHAGTIFPEDFIQRLCAHVERTPATPGPLRKVAIRARRAIPRSVKKRLWPSELRLNMDWNVVAFRAHLICRMSRILQEDAGALD